MEYKEFGSGGKRCVIMLHGGGLSWWNYREAARFLEKEYRVILPILDGHAGSDRHFSTIEDNAAEIISFIDEKLTSPVDIICGLSLGGQVLLEMLSQRGDICRHALIESAMAVPSKMTNAMLGPSLKCSYPLISKEWFAKLQFKSLHMDQRYFEDYYRDSCAVTRDDMIAFLKANTSYELKGNIKDCTADVHICYGDKEDAGIKKSAQVIHSAIPGSSVFGLPGMYHGELSMNHAEEYVKTIKDILQNEK